MKIDVIEKMKYIEKNYPVDEIECRGIKLWPFLRTGIFTNYYYSDEPVIISGGRGVVDKIVVVCKAFKNSSFKFFFQRNKILLFTDTGEVRKYNSKNIDKISYRLIDIEKNIIPILQSFHGIKQNAFSKFILNDVFSFFSLIFRFFILNIKIVNEDVLKQMLYDLGIEYNFTKEVKTIFSYLFLYNLYFSLIKPKKIYINCYYDINKMSATFIAKKKHIPVVELQHGLINDKHYAYSAYKYIPDNPYPNYIFSFGDFFKNSISPNIYDKRNIFVVGNFYLEAMLQKYPENKKLFVKKYSFYANKIIVTVVGQNDMDVDILDFINKISDDNFLFIHLPRTIKANMYEYQNDHLVIESVLDVYQCMQNSDITIACGSTCALESLVFGTPSVLLNIKGVAKFLYEPLVMNTIGLEIIDTPEQLLDTIYKLKMIDRKFIKESGKLFFADNHSKRLKTAIEMVEQK